MIKKSAEDERSIRARRILLWRLIRRCASQKRYSARHPSGSEAPVSVIQFSSIEGISVGQDLSVGDRPSAFLFSKFDFRLGKTPLRSADLARLRVPVPHLEGAGCQQRYEPGLRRGGDEG